MKLNTLGLVERAGPVGDRFGPVQCLQISASENHLKKGMIHFTLKFAWGLSWHIDQDGPSRSGARVSSHVHPVEFGCLKWGCLSH